MPKRKKNLAEMVSKMGGTDLNKNDLQALLLQLISEVRVMDKDTALRNEQIKLDAIRLLWDILKVEEAGEDITELLLSIKK